MKTGNELLAFVTTYWGDEYLNCIMQVCIQHFLVGLELRIGLVLPGKCSILLEVTTILESKVMGRVDNLGSSQVIG